MIKKFSDKSYSFTRKGENINFDLYTLTDNGFIFMYDKLIDRVYGNYESYFAHFDENTKTVTKIVDVSDFNYSYPIGVYGRVFYGGHTENGYVLLDVTPDGAKEILTVEGFNPVKLSVSQDYLLISYDIDGKDYLKAMNLKDNNIIDIEVKPYENFGKVVASSYENSGKIYYSLYRVEKGKDKGEHELFECSLKDGKIINQYPLKAGLLDFIVKDDIFAYSEINSEGEHTSFDIYIAKKTGDDIEEIGAIRDAPYGIFGNYIDKDNMIFITERAAYRYDTKKLKLEEVEIYSGESAGQKRRELMFVEMINDEIEVWKKSGEEEILEFRTFDELKKEYGSKTD